MGVVLGIDPGKSGGFALVAMDGFRYDAQAWKMPDTEGDIWELIKNLSPVAAYIERVHSMPKQGVSSTFAFGRNYGFLRGCLVASGFRWHEVTPQKWQGALDCRTKGDKNVTKARAQQLFPQLRITHAIADALLIAEDGRQRETRQ